MHPHQKESGVVIITIQRAMYLQSKFEILQIMVNLLRLPDQKVEPQMKEFKVVIELQTSMAVVMFIGRKELGLVIQT